MATGPRKVTVLHEHPEGEAEQAVGDVVTALVGVGTDVETLAIRDDLEVMVAGLRGSGPTLVVNLVTRFAGNPRLAPDVAAALELLEVPYTGASPSGLYLTSDARLARRILAAYDIPTASAPASAGATDLVLAAVGNERPTVIVDDPSLRDALAGLVPRVFAALRLRDYALLTVRVDPDRPPQLVSAQANPPLGRNDPLARIAGAAGLGYDPLITWIMDEAWDRGLSGELVAKSA